MIEIRFLSSLKTQNTFVSSCMLFQREHPLVHRWSAHNSRMVLIILKAVIFYAVYIEASYLISIPVIQGEDHVAFRFPPLLQLQSGKLLKRGLRGFVAIDCSHSI